MPFTFTPTALSAQDTPKVPYFEEARADFAPHYRSRKTAAQAQTEVINELAKLGAGGVMFQEGVFSNGKQRRYGYSIMFQYSGGQGLIRVAGLPLRHKETPTKLVALKVQALLNVRDWLKSAVTAQVFSPGSDPLIPYMIVDRVGDEVFTVADYVHSKGRLPQLAPPEMVDVLEGEVIP